MQISDQYIKYNINQLKQEITNLRNDLQKSGSAEAYGAEKKHLLMVKATIKYLKETGRITAAGKSDNIKQLAADSEKNEVQEGKAKKKTEHTYNNMYLALRDHRRVDYGSSD